ncbi:hypothetical protein [Nocardia sp. NPDC003963]
MDAEQRLAIAPLLYEDTSLLVVSRLFEGGGPRVNVVIISTDQHAVRFGPLVGKQAQSIGSLAIVTPESSMPAFLQDGLVTDPGNPPGPNARIEAILLEVKGLVDYTRAGVILEQHLSKEVAEAFDFVPAAWTSTVGIGCRRCATTRREVAMDVVCPLRYARPGPLAIVGMLGRAGS